ncbi:hypothetical protein P692DRAFT_201798559 [Suillus brevipes Sb2]|nr:hypothetical protein P692DRAFT_201798559 [Suillus brevipes Sb2]
MNDVIHHSGYQGGESQRRAQLSGGLQNQIRTVGFIRGRVPDLPQAIHEYHELPRPITSVFHSVSTSVFDRHSRSANTHGGLTSRHALVYSQTHQASGRPWKIEVSLISHFTAFQLDW